MLKVVSVGKLNRKFWRLVDPRPEACLKTPNVDACAKKPNQRWTSHGYYTTSVESHDSLIDDLNKESFETWWIAWIEKKESSESSWIAWIENKSLTSHCELCDSTNESWQVMMTRLDSSFSGQVRNLTDYIIITVRLQKSCATLENKQKKRTLSCRCTLMTFWQSCMLHF